jgi:hypothetical protein
VMESPLCLSVMVGEPVPALVSTVSCHFPDTSALLIACPDAAMDCNDITMAMADVVQKCREPDIVSPL